MMTEIQTIDGGQKRCSPQEGQHLKKCSGNLLLFLVKAFAKTSQTVSLTKSEHKNYSCKRLCISSLLINLSIADTKKQANKKVTKHSKNLFFTSKFLKLFRWSILLSFFTQREFFFVVGQPPQAESTDRQTQSHIFHQ